MTPKQFTLHKIDHINRVATLLKPKQSSNLNDYILDIIAKAESPDEKRIYSFPTGSLIAPAIGEMLYETKFEERANFNSSRLLTIELNTQATYKFTEIQRGILIQAVVDQEDFVCVVIAKADFSEYLGEKSDFQEEQGLPINRKIFKAFCSRYNKKQELQDIYIFDPHNTKYWWREFFELEQANTDESNTEKAFDSIDNVLYRYKEKYPADHNILRNMTVGYFKAAGKIFSMSDFKSQVIQNHTATIEEFPLTEIVSKLDNLTEACKFDGQFEVVPKVITARKLREVIPLNDKIDLHIKEYVENLKTDIQPVLIHGEKGIQIRTESGYKIFGGKK